MNEAIFENKLDELVKELNSVPADKRQRLTMLVNQANNSHKQLKKSAEKLNESLDYLKVGIKYMIFDLEATRRENAQLKRLVEENGN